MITEKKITFDTIDDCFFKEVAEEIKNGFTVSRLQKESSCDCNATGKNNFPITVILKNINHGLGF